MRMILRYRAGIMVRAVLLAADERTMRIAVEWERDAVELRRMGDSWLTERGDAVEIDALLQVPGIDVAAFCGAIRPRAIGAGSSFTDF